MVSTKELIKKFIPAGLLHAYHFSKAKLAAFFYRFPSRKLLVIGVTGTKGKSSVANFIWAGLQASSIKTGLLSTSIIRIGDRDSLNRFHMTMPGPFTVQKLLREMVDRGCRAAIVETTSEGILQYRHQDIIYDILVFTNLTPEHIEAHGSFEKYREAKQIIFRELSRAPRKFLDSFGHTLKTIIVNADSPEAKHFLEFPADKKITYGAADSRADIRAEHIKDSSMGVAFVVDKMPVKLMLAGDFNAINALPAIAVGKALGLKTSDIIQGIQGLATIPGRMEFIEREPFMVVVDYAHEAAGMQAVCVAARGYLKKNGRLILLFGAPGGGRDKRKRPLMGAVAAAKADIIILTTDDPYDEDPRTIIEQIASGMPDTENKPENIYKIPDRRDAIRMALKLAHPGDAVLLLGMGAEQSMLINGKSIPWDDRAVAREEFSLLVNA